ncbi:MAG: GIY-YIG nuclease family protein [Limnothrix sp.]
MTFPTLADLDFLPYIDQNGAIASDFDQKIGIYAIYDADKTLHYIGYSRDFKKSLEQHLVRCPEQCHWLKLHTCDRPSRTLLEEIRTAWLAENGATPVGNAAAEDLWTQPIDVRPTLNPEEKAAIEAAEDLTQIKLLKNHARRIEAQIKTTLEARGLKTEIRFQPKLKEQGLLDLK